MNAFHTSILLDVNPSLCTDTQHTTHLVTSISVGKYLANYMTKTSETVHQIFPIYNYMIMILNKENQGADQNQFLPILLKFSSEKCSDICCEKYRQLDSSTSPNAG